MMTLFMRFRCSGSGPPLSLQKCVTYLMHVVSVGMVSIGSHSGTKMATHVAGKLSLQPRRSLVHEIISSLIVTHVVTDRV